MPSEIAAQDVATILRAFDRSVFIRLDLRAGRTRLSASRMAEPRHAEPAASGAEAGAVVRAPRLGVFRMAEETATAIGSPVEASTLLGRIETRRRTMPVEAGRPGTFAALLVKDGDFVEYGQPLARLRVGALGACP